MKDILIVISPTNDRHLSIYKEMQKVIEEQKGKTRLFPQTAILLTGPKSYEISLLLRDIATEWSVPFSVFEVESVLLPSAEAVSTP